MTTAGERLTRRRLIRNGAFLASGSLCSCWVLGLPRIESSGSSPVDIAEKRWTIGNEMVKRVVSFVPGRGLITEQLSDLPTHADLIPPGNTRHNMAQEFSFVCNGQLCTGASAAFDLAGAAESDLPNGKSLAVRLRHRELPLEVTVAYSKS
jgi:hypothetical protein